MAKKTRHDVGREIAQAVEDYRIEDLIGSLETADGLYYNDGKSFFTDEDYDAVRRYAQASLPHHAYFTGIGSDVRGGKVPLPHKMGSLDQIYEGEMTEWINKWGLCTKTITISDKLDGTSGQVIYDKFGNLQIAFSRGNGVEGADITRHVRHFVHEHIDSTSAPAIRGEIIISKATFQNMQTAKSRKGREYKNARNMVAGMMNASKGDPELYAMVDFVAYEIIGSTKTKSEQFDLLAGLGFKTPMWSSVEGRDIMVDRQLAGFVENRKKKSVYEIDGIVIEADQAFEKRGGNDSLNPLHMIKYKVQDAENLAIATVVNVEWNVSKHGYLKPRVEIEPVDLVGVTITHATGFNAKFINDNKIGPGAQVQITRSGDVIPFIQKVVKPAKKAQLPDNCAWDWNETGVDAFTTDLESMSVIANERMIAFFASIEAPLLKQGNVEKLVHTGYNTIESIITATEEELVAVIGANGSKIFKGLHTKLTNIPLHKLMGSTTFFGRGLGRRKFKKLQTALGFQTLYDERHISALTVSDITRVDGFEEKTAQKILDGMKEFWMFFENCGDNITLETKEKTMSGAKLADEKVVFTGFRDKDLTALAEENGATMQSGISGKTTILVAKDPNSNSGKMKKARDSGVRIMGIDEFSQLLGA